MATLTRRGKKKKDHAERPAIKGMPGAEIVASGFHEYRSTTNTNPMPWGSDLARRENARAFDITSSIMGRTIPADLFVDGVLGPGLSTCG